MKKEEGTLPKIVVIAGPTASGKTSISVAMASRFNAEIINADSMQVYRGMDIGTAKPKMEEKKGVPHHLLDVANPDQEYNAAIYHDMAFAAAMDILHRGKRVFLVGGTGLYIKSLLEGLFQCPPSSPELKKALQEEWKSDGGRTLYKRLMHLDPQRAEKIHPHDRVRVIRALEIMLLTNSAPSTLTNHHGFSEQNFTAFKICLTRERPELYDRINKRTLAMIEEGLFPETEKLLSKGYSPRLKSLQSIGYKQSVAYLKGRLTREKAITEIQKETRRYAKRQITWFRGDSSYNWVDPRQEKTLAEKIETFFTVPLSHNLSSGREDGKRRYESKKRK